MPIKIADYNKVPVIKAFECACSDVAMFAETAYLTTADKYRAICNFRALCHKVKKNKKRENKIKRIVQERGIRWNEDNIELSIHKALCSNIPNEFQETSLFKRYLYSAPRIVRILDSKNIPLSKTYAYLKKYGIDKLANNRMNKDSSFADMDSNLSNEVDSQTRVSLEDIKRNCNTLIKVIKDFLD